MPRDFVNDLMDQDKKLIWQKPEFEPITDPDRIISVLAGLSKIEYDQYRETQAKALGIRVSILDEEVSAYRKGNGEPESGKNGREIKLYEPEPWPDPVDGSEVLTEALNLTKRFMMIQPEHAIQSVLWACHAHTFDLFPHSPRLCITAPDSECGKTLLLQIIGALVPRPQPVEIMKAAPFFRLTEKFKPVWLIDECDVFIKEDSDLLAALNNGWEPHGGVVRCVGDDFEPRLFSTFCPVAVGGIKLQKVLPGTTLSRSLIVELQRAVPGEIREPFNPEIHKPQLINIGRKLARWAKDHREALKKFKPVMPEGSFNRRADKWKPLFAIAQLAGGDWPGLVKRAYLAEERESKTTVKLSMAEQLLSDIREVFQPHENSIATEQLIDRLCSLDESPWPEYNSKERDEERRKIRPRQISNLLSDYKITPTTIRSNGISIKGYKRTTLEFAWNRWIPTDLAVAPLQVNNSAASSDFVAVTNISDVTDRKTSEPKKYAGCNGVTARNTPTSQKRESEGEL